MAWESIMMMRRSIAVLISISLKMFSAVSVPASSSTVAVSPSYQQEFSSSRNQNRRDEVIAFQHCCYFDESYFAISKPLARTKPGNGRRDNNNNLSLINRRRCNGMILLENINDNDSEGATPSSTTASSFLSSSKAKVNFQSNVITNTNNGGLLSNTLSPIDKFLLAITSDRTSLLLGSMGIVLLLLNRLLTFPDDVMYEASRSRIDLLGVFASGSVLLNGITKLDVESVSAEKVVLEGVYHQKVAWDVDTIKQCQLSSTEQRCVDDENFKFIVEWALLSFLKCTPAQTAVLLVTYRSQKSKSKSKQWMTLARVGILPLESQPPNKSPILDRMLSGDNSIKGGTVGGADVVAMGNRKGGPKESYLPTLQSLPGKVEFTYLPFNAQEALVLPVSSVSEKSTASTMEGWQYAVVLGGDVAKSFAPRDIAWCKEIASWIGELV